MRVTVTSSARNAGYAAHRCVESVRLQTHQVLRHIFIDADSTDDTLTNAVQATHLDPRFDIRRAPERRNALQNLLPVWRELPADEVVAWVDGDDWLAIDKALEFIAGFHEHGALVTFGQFMSTDGEMGFAGPVGPNPRHEPWRATHLKTFRAGLVQRMRPSDFDIYKDGEAWGAWDQLIMLACLEMAAERAVYIPRLLYCYNTAHSFMMNAPPEEQRREQLAVRRIRALPRYERAVWP